MNKSQIRAALAQVMVAGEWGEEIKWPNRPFNTPNAATWLKYQVLIASDRAYSLKDTDVVPLIVQVDIFDVVGRGELNTYQITDKLQSLFPKNTKIQIDSGFMQVISFSARPIQDERYHRTMCEINIDAYVDRV